MKQLKQQIQTGFTVIEIMIATTIFSVVLLVAIAGFSGIGNLFYKGVAVTQTQNIASQTMTDLKTNIQHASSVTIPTEHANYGYYCVGRVRYTYHLYYPFDASNPEGITAAKALTSATGNYGLIKDSLPGATGCASPCYGSTTTPAGCQVFTNAQEVLSDSMRLIKFQINSNALDSQLYSVYVNVAYGKDEDFDHLNDPDSMICNGSQNNQRFCAVIRLNSSVYEGLHS